MLRQALAATSANDNAAAMNDTEDPLRPHLCPMEGCSRRFKRRFTLTEHVKTHSGAKPFICPVPSCRKGFTTSGNLSRHKRVHPWLQTTLECLIVGCGCSFTTEKKLERHMKMAHFGQSTHLCPRENCGAAFSTAGNLKRHIQLQHSLAKRANAASDTPAKKRPGPVSKRSHCEGYSPVTAKTIADTSTECSDFVCPAPLQPAQALLHPTDVELLEALSCLFEFEPHDDTTIV